MKMIPATHDYYKLAPLLFALSKDKGIFASAAGELLRILTNEEVRGPINVASMVDDKQKFPIYAITKNNFTNYVFSFLKLIDFPGNQQETPKTGILKTWELKITCLAKGLCTIT